jgi:NitT/TauT family transport system substrate-binding protein
MTATRLRPGTADLLAALAWRPAARARSARPAVAAIAMLAVLAWLRAARARSARPAAAIAVLAGLTWLLACGAVPSAPAAPPGAAPGPPGAASAPPVAASPAAPAPSSGDAPPSPPESVRVGYSSLSVTSLPAWVAQDAGTFARNGLEATLDYVPSGTTLIQNMIAGGLDFGFASAETAIAATLAGAPLVILAPGVDRLTYTVHAPTALPDAASLRGRRVGITRAGSSTDFAARQWVLSLGLRPDDDVPLVQLGGQPEILAGLQAGAVDAGLLSPPANMEARRLGLIEVADLTRLPVQFYQSSIVANRQLVDTRPALVQRFLRAIVEANSVIHQDKARTKQAIGHYTETANDEVLESSYQFVLPAIPRVPLPTRAVVQEAIDLSVPTNPAAAGADPDRFFDARFVQELEDSGFIQRLYR